MICATGALYVPTKGSINRAGDVFKNKKSSPEEKQNALQTLSDWRSLHSIIINTFQATARKKISTIGCKDVIVAQRLKRLPSIVAKLERFPNMELSRMQDIGGGRIVLPTLRDVYALHSNFLSSDIRFAHQAELPPKNYITNPKPDGYRSLHQIFRYASLTKPELNGMRIELQIRSKLQHSWATAVETLGVIEKSSFKTGEGNEDFKEFFKLSSSLFAIREGMPVISDHAGLSKDELIKRTMQFEAELQIFIKLQGIVIVTKNEEKNAFYHLMELKRADDGIRWYLNVTPYSKSKKIDAELEYAKKEKETASDMDTHVVLIAAGEMKSIKRAYPNYFLDTGDFIKQLRSIFGERGTKS